MPTPVVQRGMSQGRFSLISDIDGVIHKGLTPIPGAARFVSDLQRSGRNYLFLTNSPDHSPRQLRMVLKKFGMDVPETHFYTSAHAIASFIQRHAKRPRVFVVGSAAVREELVAIGAVLTDKKPDYVLVTSGGAYGEKEINQAVNFICKGANFITANGDLKGLTADGISAGCGALISPIEKATGCKAYVVGKPNHVMIKAAEQLLGCQPEQTYMLGDSLDTDIDVGMQAQMKTILVLSGITSQEDLDFSPYHPDYVYKNVGHIRLKELP